MTPMRWSWSRLVSSAVATTTMSSFPTGEYRRELKWQLALYVGLIREAMLINIWIAAMQRIPTGWNSPYTMIFSISSSFSVNKTGVLEKSTDFATAYVSYGTSPNSGSLKEYDVICMNSDGFAIYCNITLSYGINLRRSRILYTVHCLLYRMAVSATTITVTMSRIPTDENRRSRMASSLCI